jgi:hypothetical protein
LGGKGQYKLKGKSKVDRRGLAFIKCPLKRKSISLSPKLL